MAADREKTAPLGEVAVRRLTAALAEDTGAGLDEAQFTPLSDAHLGRLYMEQLDFLRKECDAAITRTFILNNLLGAEHSFFDFLTARRRELDRARENEQLEGLDLIRRTSRLDDALLAAGLTVGLHPATGERCIRTIEEQCGPYPVGGYCSQRIESAGGAANTGFELGHGAGPSDSVSA